MWLAGSTCALTAGAMALIYIADTITELKLGNGQSVRGMGRRRKRRWGEGTGEGRGGRGGRIQCPGTVPAPSGNTITELGNGQSVGAVERGGAMMEVEG